MGSASKRMIGLISFALLCWADAGAFAEDDAMYQPAPKKEVQPPKRDVAPSCITVTVAPGPRRSDGYVWDLGKSTEAPDIKIAELTTGAKAQCAQTWTCSVIVRPTGRQITLKLSDDDIDADDPIGEGSCTIGKACNVGVAKVTTAPC